VSLLYKIGQKPVIAAVRRPGDVQKALDSSCDNIFFMNGNASEIIAEVRKVKDAKKGAFIHLDLIRGLSSTDKETVGFIADYVGADGIITPKSHLIKEAKRIGLHAILHLFILDSLAMENGMKLLSSTDADAIELMPGSSIKAIQRFAEAAQTIPIVSSGLIETKEEAYACLQAGATAVSVSNSQLWSLTFADMMEGSNN
jgi:glycerol uptake operon antiterminator